MFGIKWLESKEERWNEYESEVMPYLPDLYRLGLWLTRDKDDSEDLVQETLMNALKSFSHYEIGSNCRAWLTTIMYNLNAKRLQKLGRLKIVDDPEEKLAATIPFEPSIPQRITDEDVLQALKNMPDNFRTVVVLADVEEFSYKEIASILGLPIGTVMSRISRGRKILRQELAAYARNSGFGERNENAAG